MARFTIKPTFRERPLPLTNLPLTKATSEVKPLESNNVGDDKIYTQLEVPSVVNPPVAVPTQPIGNTPTAHLEDTQGSNPYGLSSPVSEPPEGIEPYTRQPIKDEEDKQVKVNKANSPDLVRSILNANPPGLPPLEQKPSVEKTISLPTTPLNNTVNSKQLKPTTRPMPTTASIEQAKENLARAQAELNELNAAVAMAATVPPPTTKQSTIIASKQLPSVVPFERLNCADGEVKVGGLDTYKSVYEMVGLKSHHYSTSDFSVYEKQVEKMNLGDLQCHASEMGFIPSDNRPMLMERLFRKFKEETSPTRGMNMRKTTFDHLHKNPVKMQQTLDILKKGRS